MKYFPKSKSILGSIIIVMVLVLSIYQLKDIKKVNSKPKILKEVEFKDSKIVEVNSSSILNTTYTTTLYIIKNSITMIDMRFSNSSILLLKSKKAIDKNSTIYLYDDVEFHRDIGFIYYTSEAIYNKNSEILNIDKRFKAIRGDDLFFGSKMEYDTKIGVITAKNTDTIFILK